MPAPSHSIGAQASCVVPRTLQGFFFRCCLFIIGKTKQTTKAETSTLSSQTNVQFDVQGATILDQTIKDLLAAKARQLPAGIAWAILWILCPILLVAGIVIQRRDRMLSTKLFYLIS